MAARRLSRYATEGRSARRSFGHVTRSLGCCGASPIGRDYAPVDTATYSVIFTGTVGIIGLVLGYRGTRATLRAHAVERAADREHERRLARDARLFEHRANTYAGMMKVCEI